MSSYSKCLLGDGMFLAGMTPLAGYGKQVLQKLSRGRNHSTFQTGRVKTTPQTPNLTTGNGSSKQGTNNEKDKKMKTTNRANTNSLGYVGRRQKP